MRNIAIEYKAKGTMGFVDLGAPPELKDNQLLIATRYSGITNGTERHALMAEHAWANFPYPSRHGYQNVGQIEAVGKDVTTFKPGDWVFCGDYIGHRGWIVATPQNLVQKLPDELDKQNCALMGVAGVAMRGVRRARVEAAQNVLVYGIGLIGQFAAQSARALGATVTVADINQRRLDVATELGAHKAVNMKNDGAWEQLKAGGPYNTIVDGSGAPSLFLDIHNNNLLSYKGVILGLAVRSETVFQWGTFHGREASIEVSCHFTMDDLRVLLHFMKQGVIRMEPAIWNRTPIEKAEEIYATMRDRPSDLLGVVFDWS